MSGVWTRTWSSARKTCATRFSAKQQRHKPCFSAQKRRRNCEYLRPSRGSLRLQSLEWVGDRRRAPASPHACKDALARLGPCRGSSCLQSSSVGRCLSNVDYGSWHGIWSASLAAMDCDSSNRKCARCSYNVGRNSCGGQQRLMIRCQPHWHEVVILGGCTVLFVCFLQSHFWQFWQKKSRPPRS
jgi:hypothetical protein